MICVARFLRTAKTLTKEDDRETHKSKFVLLLKHSNDSYCKCVLLGLRKSRLGLL